MTIAFLNEGEKLACRQPMTSTPAITAAALGPTRLGGLSRYAHLVVVADSRARLAVGKHEQRRSDF